MDPHPQSNPYAKPIADQKFAPGPAVVSPNAGYIGREGNQLVVQKNAALPKICVKTGEPAVTSVERLYYWSHPALLLTIFLNVLVYAILVIILRKKMTVHVPLSQEAFDKRKRILRITRTIMILGVCGIIGAIAWGATSAQPYNSVGAYALLLGFFSFFSLLIAACFDGHFAKIIKPKRIDDNYGWFKGVSPKLLDRLPQVPAG